MQKVYNGKNEFVFVSYSHLDQKLVFGIIGDLMLSGCNLWYDVGLHAGEDWNDEIAEHLLRASCVLLMVSKNAIASQYIKDEIAFAKTKRKKIYPVFLENIILPPGLELMLGATQCISFMDDIAGSNRFKFRESIANDLPTGVFETISVPFYCGENNSFFLDDTSKVFPESAYFAGEQDNSFEVNVKRRDKKKKTIYRFTSRPGYDMKFSLNAANPIDDSYNCDDDSKFLLLSLSLSFLSKDLLPWPDFDCLLTICISRLEAENPKITLVDIKPKGTFLDQQKPFIDCYLTEIEKSFYPQNN